MNEMSVKPESSLHLLLATDGSQMAVADEAALLFVPKAERE